MKSYDAAIVGAGIVGAACAAALSREGLTVVVLDAAHPAGGATAAGMGHIVVMDDSPAQFALTSYSQRLWRELAGDLPEASEYERCGTIWVAEDVGGMPEVLRKKQYYEYRDIATEILDETMLREAEPNLRPGLAGGLLVASDSVVYQLCATSFLLDRAKEKGAEVRPGCRAVEITDGSVRIENGETITAGNIINAAGAAAPDLSPGLKIVKRKGHLVITERSPGFIRHQVVELGYLKSAHGHEADSVAFNVQPRSTGQVLVGSSRQFGVDDDGVDLSIVGRMTSRAFDFMPGLRGLSASRIWTGFRPATPDNLPYIGKLQDAENVYIAAGHEGLGITTSLGTAELIADAIAGRESAIWAGAYAPSRSFA